MPSDAGAGAHALGDFLAGKPWVALCGAGLSTDSGIPDYRGPGSTPRKPMTLAEFRRSAASRRRYWARATLGFARIAGAQPNAGHRGLVALEREGQLLGAITQNVDGLHRAAGSIRTLELHGCLSRVRCMTCGGVLARAFVQAQHLARNPGLAKARAAAAPDGDAELSADWADRFEPLDCPQCAGPLKPDVVFFGESCPSHWVSDAYRLLDRAEALVVLGSSLTVFSGYRFVRRAFDRRLPIAIVNRGPTRGDPYASLQIDASVGPVLQTLAQTKRPARS